MKHINDILNESILDDDLDINENAAKKSPKRQNVKKVLSILNFFTHFADLALENNRKIAYICSGTFF
mgnify:CR=1 FL=1